ncbi:ribonucleoside-diphosphate reductase, adenosylcobalamin-dependent [candidate division CPR3 bacterium GWE2_35_7]|nr:MAG: ribonucleoside-diphosphate reductase, adenosylcobalamin-dependent [candidate division CPR3 bacterium GWE2_35_7]
MLSVSIEHPDVENFIDAKMTPGKVTGANVSVRITDEFMDAVIKNKPFVQTFPIGSKNPTYKNVIDAGKLWKKIIHNAWQSAEPGILFWDTIIKESVPDSYADLGFKTTSTNPCGEIPLCPYDSCRLIALNLYSYVKNPFTKNASFDFDLFKKHVSYTQRMMDDIIDLELEKIDVILDKVNSDPEPEEIKSVERNLWTNIKNKSIAGRRTGIGVTAEGDMLAALGYRYGTEEATKFSVKIHQTLAIETYRSSILLARERKPFPIFDFKREKDNPFIKRLEKIDPSIIKQMKKYGRRNIALLTIAPTGSVSICTQTTSGIEPVFMVSYKRRRKINPNDKNVKIAFVDEVGDSWEEYNVFHPKFVIWLKLNNYDPKKISLLPEKELNEIIKKSPYYKATANDVDWVAKVDMQGKIQKWVDHSISVTVNIPKETTEDLVDKIYQTAWKSGCKGVTIYREGSRAGVLISKETTQKQKSNGEEIVENEAPSRPKALEAEVVRFQNDYDKWIAVVGTLKGKPYEIFTGKADEFFIPPSIEKGWVIRNINGDGKSRYDFEFVDKDGYKTITEGLSRSFNKEFWNYAKLISGVLRHGMPLPHVLSLVSDLNLNSTSINTWKNGVQRAFKKFIPDGTKAVNGEVCFYCKAKDSLIYQEGCLVCKNCGQSKCG